MERVGREHRRLGHLEDDLGRLDPGASGDPGTADVQLTTGEYFLPLNVYDRLVEAVTTGPLKSELQPGLSFGASTLTPGTVQVPGVNVAGVDVAGLTQSAQADAWKGYTADMQSRNAMLGGLARWLRAAGYDASWHDGIADPELVKTAPHLSRVRRLDETRAARKPRLRWSRVAEGSDAV